MKPSFLALNKGWSRLMGVFGHILQVPLPAEWLLGWLGSFRQRLIRRDDTPLDTSSLAL